MANGPVGRGREHAPRNRKSEGSSRNTGNKPRQHRPRVDVASTCDQTELAQEFVPVVETRQIVVPGRATDSTSVVNVRQIVGYIGSTEHPRRPPGPRRSVGSEIGAQRQIPGVFVEKIQNVLELTGFRCHALDARQFAIDSVEHLDKNGDQKPGDQPSLKKQPSDEEADHAGRQRHLIRSDRRRRQQTDQEILERRVEVGRRQVFRSLLDVVEQRRPSALLVLVRRDRHQMDGHAAALLADVGIERLDVANVDAFRFATTQAPRARHSDDAQQHCGLAPPRRNEHIVLGFRQPIEQSLVDE